jgi:hypothetical protein
VELQTRPNWSVLDNLVAKLETLPPHQPDRPQLIRTIIGLCSEIEHASPPPLVAAN